MSLVRLILLAAVSMPSAVVMVHGLAFNVFNPFQANPELPTLAQAQQGEQFKVKLDIGQKEQTRLFLDGLKIELLQEKAEKAQRTGLPGVDGPHPRTSSGALAIHRIKNPFFIDMYGSQKVRFEKGCWEMVWKKDDQSGSIVMGFDVPFGAKRNGAELPKGPLYLSFPVWTQDGLVAKQAEWFETEKRAKGYLQERDDELKLYQNESNLFKKALHYRNAAAAVEKYDFTGIRWMQSAPSSDEVIPIANGLMMSNKGSVWNKDKSFMGGKHLLLGSAVLSSLEEEEEEKQQSFTLKP